MSFPIKKQIFKALPSECKIHDMYLFGIEKTHASTITPSSQNQNMFRTIIQLMPHGSPEIRSVHTCIPCG